MVRTTTFSLIATFALFVSVTVPMPVADPLLKVHAAPDLDASFVYMMPRAQKGGKSSVATLPGAGSSTVAGGTSEGGSAPAAPAEG
ncbi:hypothetical protein JMJ35_003881 [Cladonia borealis]|uniref:Secreted protein n=1 Tax=Cladonia borealis TaxID=184061 RepID=A0AA39R5R8_9LECA|nr:hypothetical protein JMJ35_003881 [Cladonia borealis]